MADVRRSSILEDGADESLQAPTPSLRWATKPWPDAPRSQTWLRALGREPFLHFLALGLLIFLLSGYFGGTSDRYRIAIEADQVSRIATSYELQFGNPPSPEELQHIVDREIEEDILYREGVAIGLDQGDEIVRRRIAQKFQFLQQDLNVVAEPTDALLQSFYERNIDRYTTPVRVSFSHIYFSPDRDGEDRAELRAAEALGLLKHGVPGDASPRGDQFAGQSDYWSVDAPAVSRLFGDSELSRAVFNLPLDQWSGPLRSGYGWHLVYARATEPPRRLPLTEIHERVRTDYLEHVRQEQSAAAFMKLKQKYTIIRHDRGQ